MTLSKRIAKSISWLGLSEMIIAVSGFIFTFFIAKYFSVSEFGELNYAFMLVTTLGVFIELGLTKLSTREISLDKDHAKKHLFTSIILRAMFAIPTFFLLIIVNKLTGTSENANLLSYILFIYVAFLYINQGFFSVYRALEMPKLETIAKTTTALTLVAGTIITSTLGISIKNTAWIYALSTALPFIINFILIRSANLNKKKYKPSVSFFKKTLTEAWPFALTTIFVSLYYFIDSIFLGIISGNEAVAYYNIAYKILFISIISIGFFYTGLFPIATKYARDNIDLYNKILKKTYALIMSFALLFSIGVYFFTENILKIIFDDKYNESIFVTQILGTNAIMIAFNILLGHLILDIFNQQKKSTLASGVGAAANITLNLLLIPQFGIIGAAIATLATEIIVGIMLYKMSRKVHKIALLKNTLLLGASACVTFTTLFLLQDTFHFTVNILIMFATFGASTILFKVFTKDDFELIKSLR